MRDPQLDPLAPACSCCNPVVALPTEPEPAKAGAGFMNPEAKLSLFNVSGLCCPVEENLIRTRLSGLDGVLDLRVNLLERKLQVLHLPAALPMISETLAGLNLGAQLQQAEPDANQSLEAAKSPWPRLIVAGALALLSEVAELGLEWAGLSGLPELLPALLALAAIALTGLSTYKKGWQAVAGRNLNINALMSVAVTGAMLIGQFPEAAMVMVLFKLSEVLEDRALNRARNAVKNLLDLAPDTAWLQLADGSWRETDVREIEPGSLIRVRPGEKVGLDGIVRSGSSAINQAPITGESIPVEKEPGDPVYAGTINTLGLFEFESTAKASDTTLARIIHAVEQAQASRAPIQRFVDRFASWYTPLIFVAALLVALIPPLVLNAAWSSSIYMGLVILVIGCPCALVISTPITLVSGMAAASRSGLLVKGGIFLELGRKLNWLCLDKTGTLTFGQPAQTDFIPLEPDTEQSQSPYSPNWLRGAAAGLATLSGHPVSEAIARQALADQIQPLPVDKFTALPGLGARGLIDGQVWSLGSGRLAEQSGIRTYQLTNTIDLLEQQGKTAVILTGPHGPQAVFAVADAIRPHSAEAVAALAKAGIKTMLLTGDNEHTAAAIAKAAGINSYRANLLPEDKLGIIEELRQSGAIVGMAGDGINDAPALTRADIGFGMAGIGTDVALESADVAVMDDDLRKIPRFIQLSRSTWAILLQNISLALGIKALFFGLTLAGHATMWMAVFADMGTSLLVIANGLRALRK